MGAVVDLELAIVGDRRIGNLTRRGQFQLAFVDPGIAGVGVVGTGDREETGAVLEQLEIMIPGSIGHCTGDDGMTRSIHGEGSLGLDIGDRAC